MPEALARRVLRALLALYPASFRNTVGDDLVETALWRWRDARRQSAVAAELRFWSTEGVRFAIDGVLERLRLLPTLASDLAHGWRQVRRAPGHHGLAIATLALGVGATTTIFTVADAVVFRPLAYEDADRLYLIHARLGSMELSSNSLPNVEDLKSSVKSMAWLAAAQDRSPALTDAAAEPERISVLDVTQEYLPKLGARVQLGRAFSAEDYAAGAERVAIVSHWLWRRRWGGNRGVVGSSVQLTGVMYTVIGVMGPAFRDPEPIESGALTGAWVPVRAGSSAYAHRDAYGFRVIGRLADGVSIEAARRELSAAGARLAAAYPEANRVGDDALDFVLHPLREFTVGEAHARLLLLLGAVVLLLLLSCANVANLFLARGVARESEFAVRSALGATRARLALQLFGESLVTATIAAAWGALLAELGVRAFVAAAPTGIPRLHEVTVDVRVLAFVMLLTVVTAVLFGIVPALRGSGVAAASAAGARTTDAHHTQRLQSALVALEVAISLVLLTGSALLLNSFARMLRVDPGFDGGDVITVDVRAPATADNHAEELIFYRTLMERAQALPGVARAALVYTAPGVNGGAWSPVTLEDALARQATEPSRAAAYGPQPGENFMRTNPMYGDLFDALDMRLLAGRGFGGNPGPNEPLVVVLNQAAARKLFPDVDRPIGRRLALGSQESAAALREVVGIVADVRQRGPAHDADPQIYLPYGQRDIPRLSLVLEVKPGAVVTPEVIRRLVREIARDVPVDRVDALSTRYAATADQSRFLTLLLSVFAVLGLTLASVGTYATAVHALSRRLRELGIRLALGARAGDVFRLALRRALLIALAGVAAGLLLTLALTRFLESYLFGISTRDPLTFTGAALLIGACAVLASLGPALHAARVNPNDVLRSP